MSRYFIELSYKGTDYSGFQSQNNANTIQAEIEKAIELLKKEKITLIGSSRTDTGVHALKNYFHFDSLLPFDSRETVYKLNAILPGSIAISEIIPVKDDAHCRFDALSREYKYFIYQKKNPFLQDRAFYFPYKLTIDKMQAAAQIIKSFSDFTSFSKRNTQVKTFNCLITESKWIFEEDCLVYHVKANRFLRGMVRALTATMLKVGRSKMTLKEFTQIIESKDCTKASFAVPPHGLFLVMVEYPVDYFISKR
jgi:tRNA pseudouridine38-40 synthase